MGLTQARAADLLGMSLSGYRSAEYRATDHGECNKTLAGFANLMYSLRVAVEIPMAKDSP
jgi:hypothetical protein